MICAATRVQSKIWPITEVLVSVDGYAGIRKYGGFESGIEGRRTREEAKVNVVLLGLIESELVVSGITHDVETSLIVVAAYKEGLGFSASLVKDM